MGENRKKANLGKHKSAVLLHKAAESSTRSKKLSSHRKQAWANLQALSRARLSAKSLCGEFLMVTWRLKVWFDCAESRSWKKEAQSYKQTWDWTMLLTFKHFSWDIVLSTDAFWERHCMRIAMTTRSHSSSHVWTMPLTVSWVHGPACPVKRHWNFTRQNTFDLFSTSKWRTAYSLAFFSLLMGLTKGGGEEVRCGGTRGHVTCEKPSWRVLTCHLPLANRT